MSDEPRGVIVGLNVTVVVLTEAGGLLLADRRGSESVRLGLVRVLLALEGVGRDAASRQVGGVTGW